MSAAKDLGARLGDALFMPEAPAERLAMLRILVGAFATVYFTVRAPHFMSYGEVDPLFFKPVGIVSALPRPVLPWAASAWALITPVLAACFCLGYRFRLTAPVFAFTQLWVLTYSNSFGMILHSDNLMCVQILVLALSPAGDALSLDARAGRKRRGEASSRYGWAIRLICILCVATYVLAAITKVKNSGFEFVDSVTLRNYVAYDNVRKIELGSIHSPLGAWLLPYAAVFSALAAFSFVLEFGAALALVDRRVGMVWATLIWGFHVGVLALMMIGFVYQLTGIAFAAFFPLERILGWAWVRRFESLRRR